jgi:hypothetical protein
MRKVLSSLSTALGLAMAMVAPNPRPGGRRRAAAWAARPTAGIVLALIAAGAAVAYAATETALPAASSRSSWPPKPHKEAKLPTPHKEAEGTQALCSFNNMPYSGSTWMHDIAPCIEYRKLSEIAIPGSHDSATYGFRNGEGAGFATTQDEDITQQLDDGMRSFDIRVDYQTSGAEGPGWYANHGVIHSLTLTLPDILVAISLWATQPGHEQEIIRLNLTITGGDDQQDCRDFGTNIGYDALVTPNKLVDYFGTTNPGVLTLGQLWSLPNYNHTARVIMSNIPCLQEATGETLPQWGPSGGYFADQCSAEGLPAPVSQQPGIINRVLPAAENRYTAAGGTPEGWGPPAPAGSLYELDIQGTPELDPFTCAVTPRSLLSAEKEVIQALFNSDFYKITLNLNYVVADFVEETDLLSQVVSTDTWPRVPDPPFLYGPDNGVSGQLTVFFNLPENYGTAPITSYTVTATDKSAPGKGKVTVSGDSSPIVVTGLFNGDRYEITVTATNPYGTSPPSAAATIEVGVPPSIVSLPAANGIIGEPYTSKFVATGTPPITFRLGPEGNPPPGLTLYPVGTLTGTPTKAGSYGFEVLAQSLVDTSGIFATITISAGVNAKIAGCSPRAGNNAWSCTLDVTLPPLAVDTVFSVGIGGGGFTNPSGSDRPQVIAFKGCQVAPLPSPYYLGNGGYNRYDVNISTGGCTDGSVVVLEEAVTAAAGATITQSVTVPGLPTSTDTFVLPPPGEPGSASPSPTAERDRARHRGTASRDAVRDHKPDLR